MDLTHLHTTDPNMLLGIANMKLRHECDSLDDLAHVLDMSEEDLAKALDEIGYHYDSSSHQFKSI